MQVDKKIKKVKDIIDGLSNYFIGSNPVNLKIAKQRAEICVSCDDIKYGKHAAVLPDMQINSIQGHYCGNCKCPISTAVRSSGYKCPLKKW